MMPKWATGRVRAAAAAVGLVVVSLAAVVAGIGMGGPGPGVSPSSAASTAVAAVSVAPSLPAVSTAPSGAAPTTGASSPAATEPPLSSASPTPGPSAIPATRLQARLDLLRARWSVPGVSVAILWDDGRSWVGASGLRDVARATRMTTDTSFALASISKTFTAAVVLELVDEGRLALDQPVAPLVPSFRLDRRITVRMLLDHTSGLPDFFLGKGIDAALQGAPDATWTPARAWSFVPRKHAVPGTTWSYSNTNYLLLGEVVRSVTGHPLAGEIRRRLLDPLGLGTAWYQAAEAPRSLESLGYRLVAASGGHLRAVAVATASAVMPFRSVVTAAGGAGSIAATALDTARWMQAYAGGRVLSPQMQLMMLDDVAVTVALKARIPYGLGIQRVTLAGRVALGHSGRYLGFRNVVRYLPAAGVTIAVLTNQGTVDPSRFAASLLQIVLSPPSLPSPSASPSGSPGASPSSAP
jgi:D-alanyl-D-alanine carboxypeptidase